MQYDGVMDTTCGWRGLSNVQCDEVMTHRVVWWRLVGAVPMCPPASPCRGASVVQFPAHNACVFGMETPLRERSGGHIGIAPTVSFGQIACGQLVTFGWITCGTVNVVWVDCVCGFVCWENGAQEPTPSVLYFCQPRVADERRLPWGKSRAGTYAIGIVLFKINFHVGKSFIRRVW